MKDATRVDVRENPLYKLILNQKTDLEAMVVSCSQLFKDLRDFNYSDERKKELLDNRITDIYVLRRRHSKAINDFDVGSIW